MKKVFIDCGSNLGQGYEKVKSLQKIDSSWDVFMFEPNPNCIDVLKRKYSRCPNITIRQEGVYNKNGTTEFFITTDLSGKINKHSEGSKISEMLNMFTSRKIFYDYADPIIINLIRLSDFIKSLQSNEIVLKIDVEGCEFDIINDLIDEKSLLKIRHVYVEFHNYAIDKDKVPYYNKNKNDIIRIFKEKGVGFTEWN